MADRPKMRLFQINDSDSYCGRTLLEAVRAAMKETGLPYDEIVDRDWVREIARPDWDTEIVSGDDFSTKTTIAAVMAKMDMPGLVVTSNW